MNSKQSLTSFSVRRNRLDAGVSIAFFLIFTGLFIWEVFRFTQALADGSPFPDLSYFQSANQEFWANLIVALILFFALWAASLYFMLAAVCWQIRVDGDLLTVQKPIRRRTKMHIGEISGVDVRNGKYVLMRGTKALIHVKPGDIGFQLLMTRLGVGDK